LNHSQNFSSIQSTHKSVYKWLIHTYNLVSDSFGMRQHMWLEVSGLSKSFITSIKWTNVWSVTCVNPNVSTKVKIQWKSLPTTFKGTLEKQICVLFWAMKWVPPEMVFRQCEPTGLLSFELSTKACWHKEHRYCNLIINFTLPHSAHTWTLGPCVCRCFLMAAWSLNSLLQPCKHWWCNKIISLWGHLMRTWNIPFLWYTTSWSFHLCFPSHGNTSSKANMRTHWYNITW